MFLVEEAFICPCCGNVMELLTDLNNPFDNEVIECDKCGAIFDCDGEILD